MKLQSERGWEEGNWESECRGLANWRGKWRKKENRE